MCKAILLIFIPKLKLNSSCLVEIEIFTGRTHQIRVQSNHIGHMINRTLLTRMETEKSTMKIKEQNLKNVGPKSKLKLLNVQL